MKNLSIFIFLILFNSVQGQVKTLRHTLPVKSLALSKDGTILISGAGGYVHGEMITWETNNFEKLSEANIANNSLEDIKTSKDYIFAVGGQSIGIWDTQMKLLAKKLVPGAYFTNLVLGNSNNFILAGNGNKIRLGNYNHYNSYYNRIKFLKRYIEQKVTDLSYLKKSDLMITCGKYKKSPPFIKIWTKEKSPKQINIESPVTSLETISENHFLTADIKGNITLWNIEKQQSEKSILSLGRKIHKIKLNHRKDILAIILENDIYIYDFKTNKVLEKLIGHSERVRDIIFTKDDRLLISASNDKTVKIWKVLSNKTYIEYYVNKEMEKWQVKSEFEKTETYIQRVTDKNRKKKIEEFTQIVIDKLAMQERKILWKVLENKYDADNEVFRLKIQGIEEFKLKVPVSEAKLFAQNIDKLVFTKPHFALSAEDTFPLVHLLVSNPKNSKTYTYNPDNNLKFQPQNIEISLEPLEVNIKRVEVPEKAEEISKTTQVERVNNIAENLPKTLNQNPDGIAVVIGNKDYDNSKTVDFAINDARLMKKYLVEVLGYKEANILYVENASLADFKMIFGDKNMHEGQLFNLVKAQKSNVFIYYSGHGVPSLKNKQGYFVPKECNTQYVELTGYSLNTFYENLAKIPATSIKVVLDACFSGADMYENISPIDVKSKGILGIKKGVLFASSSGTEVSCWYNEKKQGLFTYFFFKAIHNKNADLNQDNQLSFEEIYQYISDKTEGVPYYARRLHGITQNPVLQGDDAKDVFIQYAE